MRLSELEDAEKLPTVIYPVAMSAQFCRVCTAHHFSVILNVVKRSEESRFVYLNYENSNLFRI